MYDHPKRSTLFLAVLLALGGFVVEARADDPPAKKPSGTSVQKAEAGEWIVLWDGKTFQGWKASEHKESWKIENGAIICHGPRSHLYYVGPHRPFRNFELRVDVKTAPGSNAGIYFHTKYQETGWPKIGYEAQVNNSHADPKRTGSLYGVVNIYKAPAKDNEWFTESIIVQGRRIIIKVNGRVLVDYTEPPNKKPEGAFIRVLGKGDTFALQAHDPKSIVAFKNIRVRKLP